MTIIFHDKSKKPIKTEPKQPKKYILKKDCRNIGKEAGDYYNNEYSDSIEDLIAKGIIEELVLEEFNKEDLPF